MRNSIIIAVLLFCNFFAAAQKSRSYLYSYTKTSDGYFTEVELDSLFYAKSAALFQENNIPDTLFKKKYPTIKNVLATVSRGNITRAFRELDITFKKAPEKNTLLFKRYKQSYIDALEEEISKTFTSNKILSQYLAFNAGDRITYFNSTVKINADGTLWVQEKISIHNGNGQLNGIYTNSELEASGAINNQIKRGIRRDFPLFYVNEYKLFQNTTFKLKQVLRNGEKENYHTEKHDNGISLFTGTEYNFLETGNYTYTIIYETEHQLKSLKDYDELAWNVTGTGWAFRIDSAKCIIILPKGAITASSKCYTGAQGQTGEDCNITTQTMGDSSIIIFKTTKPLPPNHGITVATSWQKGIVIMPSSWQQTKYYIWNNKGVFFLPFAALLSAIFCFIYWFKYGRDPEKGVAYPLYEPPAGFSPAALGYIYYLKFDRKLTAATIVDAAVRNKIKIDVERDGWLIKHNEYVISKSTAPAKKPLSEYEEFESDIEDLIDTRIEKGEYNKDLGDLNTAVQSYCEKNYKNKDGRIKKDAKGFFAWNNSYTTFPILICIAAAVWGFFGSIVDSIKVKNFWQLGYFVIGIILCSVVLKIFSKLLVAYSPEGRKLADKIAGFRMFLATTDEKRLDILNPPKKSLELYEKYLPFAIALGCDIQWGKQFEGIIDSAYLDPTSGGHVFTQSFTRDSNSGSSFASSFSGAISSASSPPSSSSGGGSSFGGGSSGGGGGGGGGGGW